MKKALLIAVTAALLASFTSSLGQGPMQGAKPTPGDKARLTKLEKAYTAAKAILGRSPHNAKAQKDFVNLAMAYGNECMYTPVLDRKVKYRQALHVFREVLKVEPNQRDAKDESDMIVKIYKSLGRPIPPG